MPVSRSERVGAADAKSAIEELHRAAAGARHPITRLALGVAGCAMTFAVAAPAALAQGQPATKPASCQLPEHRQFDFWLGSWTVTTPDGKPAGNNTIRRLMGQCALQEHWVGTSGMRGTSINIYDVTTKRWHQTWVDNQGTLLLLDGTFSDGKMTMTDQATVPHDGHSPVNRITWQREGGNPDRVRQIWDSSADGGRTWTPIFDGLYVRTKS